ncbi:hypothetical protein RSOLAG1IB_00683 [Rhizoctonia solani AG-1 IB]|uniref:Uncharacterized protein n=1 Tax=Thanatephorus cucumeris (strain AG1-IB / isolate 7/3/14) TaxID=1108050 RepID=A0A0B7F3P9_THACB|nr:hypothetical protein RSOLAG1IB_00683 [Rhizoctonia solani AG-1 IB]
MRFGSVRVVKHRMTWIFGGYKNPIQESSKVVGLVTQDFGSDILSVQRRSFTTCTSTLHLNLSPNLIFSAFIESCGSQPLFTLARRSRIGVSINMCYWAKLGGSGEMEWVNCQQPSCRAMAQYRDSPPRHGKVTPSDGVGELSMDLLFEYNQRTHSLDQPQDYRY